MKSLYNSLSLFLGPLQRQEMMQVRTQKGTLYGWKIHKAKQKEFYHHIAGSLGLSISTSLWVINFDSNSREKTRSNGEENGYIQHEIFKKCVAYYQNEWKTFVRCEIRQTEEVWTRIKIIRAYKTISPRLYEVEKHHKLIRAWELFLLGSMKLGNINSSGLETPFLLGSMKLGNINSSGLEKPFLLGSMKLRNIINSSGLENYFSWVLWSWET